MAKVTKQQLKDQSKKVERILKQQNKDYEKWLYEIQEKFIKESSDFLLEKLERFEEKSTTNTSNTVYDQISQTDSQTNTQAQN